MGHSPLILLRRLFLLAARQSKQVCSALAPLRRFVGEIVVRIGKGVQFLLQTSPLLRSTPPNLGEEWLWVYIGCGFPLLHNLSPPELGGVAVGRGGLSYF